MGSQTEKTPEATDGSKADTPDDIDDIVLSSFLETLDTWISPISWLKVN